MKKRPPLFRHHLPLALPGQRIGLYGGSFNPAHAGHLHVSRQALKRLGLDAVWWLVSPQNPLKAMNGMAPLAARLASARAVARDPRCRPLALESVLGTRYTADTLALLKALYPQVRFVWLMGADNLAGFHRWQRWRAAFDLTPIAILDRPGYSAKALAAPAARRLAARRLPQRVAKTLADRKAPAWSFLTIPRHPASASAIRAANGGHD